MTFIDEQNEYLAKTDTSKLLKQFAASTMLSNSSYAIYMLCDAIFVSIGIAPLALGGLAVAFPIITLCTAFCLLISVGGNIHVTTLLRNNDMESVGKFASGVLTFAFVVGIALTAIFHAFPYWILKLCGASEQTMPYAFDYTIVIIAGLCIIFLAQAAMGLLRGIGAPEMALRGYLYSAVFNIVLDAILIFGFGLGMKGVALAYILCQALAFGHCYYQLNKFLHVKLIFLHGLTWKNIKIIIYSGITPFCSNLVGTVIALLINTTLIAEGGVLGDMYISTYCIIQRVTQVPVSLAVGFGRGMQTLVAFNFSAALYTRVRELLMKSIYAATIVMSVCFVFVALFPRVIAMMFSLNEEMTEMMAVALRIGLCIFPFIGSQMMSVCFFSAISRTKVSMLLSLSRQLCILLPLLIFLPTIMGVNGVWWSMSIADIISVIMAWLLLWIETKRMIID